MRGGHDRTAESLQSIIMQVKMNQGPVQGFEKWPCLRNASIPHDDQERLSLGLKYGRMRIPERTMRGRVNRKFVE